jgi:hypothetical protein
MRPDGGIASQLRQTRPENWKGSPSGARRCSWPAGPVGDPAIVKLRTEADRHRRQALTPLIDGLADRGVLAAGLSRQRAVDRAWMLTGVEIYLTATDGCGWSDADYARWLAALLISQLLTESAR